VAYFGGGNRLECAPGAYNVVDRHPAPQSLWLTKFFLARCRGSRTIVLFSKERFRPEIL